MKHFFRFLALIIAFCMIFPLSACLGEEAEETTAPPATSAEETTAEETAPPEDETTSLYDKLAAMEPIALLRLATKNTRNYKSFIKTTEISFEIPNSGKQTRQIIYAANGKDYSEEIKINDELQSFVMYSKSIFAFYISMLGDMGYSAEVETEEQYKKLEGSGPTVSNPTLFDFSGNENFGDGLISAGDEGFIVNIDLTEKGKNALVGNIPGAPESPYTVGRAGIVAWIDREGNIVSVSLEAELNLKTLDGEVPIDFRTFSTLENIGEEVEIIPPDELEIYQFQKFDTFYNFINKLYYNYYRIVNYKNSYSFSDQIRITKIEDNKQEDLYNCTVRGSYRYEDSITVSREFYKFNDIAPHESVTCTLADGKITHTDFDGTKTERNDISADGMYDFVFYGMFGNFIGFYEQGALLAEKDKYSFTLTEETALEYFKEYLALAELDADKCEIEILVKTVTYSGAKDSWISNSTIYIEANIKYEGRQFKIAVNDQLGQSIGR